MSNNVIKTFDSSTQKWTNTNVLTDKTIDSTTNTVSADNLHSATTKVNVSSAVAPTANQVLTASSGTVAIWKTPLIYQLFRTYIPNGTTQAISNSTYTTVTTWTTSGNYLNSTTGSFNATTGIFTFGTDAAGSYWQVNVSLRFANNTSNTRWIAGVINSVTGFDIAGMNANTDSTSTWMQWSGIMRFNNGDTFGIQAWQNAILGASINIEGGESGGYADEFGSCWSMFRVA